MSRLKKSILALVLPILLAAGQTWAGPRIVGTIEVTGTRFIAPEEVLAVLPFKSGDPFQEAMNGRAHAILTQWGRFSDIHVTTAPEGEDRVRVDIHLSEARLISAVDVTGAYPFLAIRLKRMLTLRPGMVFHPEALAAERARLLKFYESSGFTGTEIAVAVREKADSPWVIPHFSIHRGRRQRIGTIHFAGNRVLPERVLRNEINTYLLYAPRRLKRNLADIKEAYAHHGYPAARVRLTELRMTPVVASVRPIGNITTRRGPVVFRREALPGQQQVHLWIAVTEGKKAAIRITGNRAVSRRKIRQAITVLKEGYWDPYELRRTEEAVTKLYHQEGFLEAHVTMRKAAEDTESVALALEIEEGPRSRIAAIEIDGNHGLSDGKIKGEMETREDTLFRKGVPDAKALEHDLPRIIALYRREGHPDVVVGMPEERVDPRHRHTITIPVQEGERVRIGQVEFKGLTTLVETKARRLLKWGSGRPYNPAGIDSDKENLLVELASRGRPHAQARVEIRREGARAHLRYEVDEGPPVAIGRILVVGNQTTKASAIEKSISVKPGKPFSYKQILESQAGLRRISAFANASIEAIGMKEREPVVHPLVRIEENPPIVANFKASYNTDTNFTGVLTLTDRNFMDEAKRGNIQLTGGNDLERAELNLINSRLFGIALEGIANGFGEYQRRASFNYFRYGSSVAVIRDFTPTLTGLAKYEVARTSVTSSIPGADPSTELARDLTAPKATLSLSYDTRDSFADARRGLHTLVSTEFFNQIFGAGANFVRVSTGVAHYLTAKRRFTLTNSVRLSGIQRYFESETVPGQEKLYLGGDYTVRGFNQDALVPTGGEVSVLATTEFHTRLVDNFKFVLFTDTGSLTDRVSVINTDTLRHSAGAGIHYVTPIGPIRLDWALKLDRKTGEDLYRIHFIFGYAF